MSGATVKFRGKVIQVVQETARFPDGSTGRLEMIRHPGATAVVPLLDPPTDPDPRALLIRQYRHAAKDFIWEIPAGTLDKGESPSACAQRELREEAGVVAKTLVPLTSVFTTPGFTDEIIHLFLAHTLSFVEAEREPDEFISVHDFRWSDIGKMIRRGDIRDAKSLCGLMFVQGFLRK